MSILTTSALIVLVHALGLLCTAAWAGQPEAGHGCQAPFNPSQTREWRTEKIRAVWSELHFGEPPLPDADMEVLIQAQDPGLVDGSAGPASYFVNGWPMPCLSPTGMLLTNRAGKFLPHCSVVLTRPDRVLTARHCVDERQHPREFLLYFAGEGLRQPARDGVHYYCRESESTCTDGAGDLALVELDSPYTITPLAQPPDWTQDLQFNSQVRAQGYGDSNALLSDRGLLLQGSGSIAPCTCSHGGDHQEAVLCLAARYSTSDGYIGTFVNLGGHSGGPLFDRASNNYRILGIASNFLNGCRADGLSEARYVNLVAPRFRSWLAMAFPPGGPTVRSPASYRVLLTINPAFVAESGSDVHQLDLNRHTIGLLVSLNHEVAGRNSARTAKLTLDLPPPHNDSCTRLSSVESCTVNNPAPGRYSIGVRRVAGNPAYQLTVVALYEQ